MKLHRFVVAFQPLAEIHLTKDIGGIPAALSRYWEIDRHFIGGNATPKGKQYTRAAFCYVPSNIIQKFGFLYTVARTIQVGDIVNIYHLSLMSVMLVTILRMLHGDRIKIYLKLDMNTRKQSLRIAKIIAGMAAASSMRDILTKIAGLWICRHVDFISAESSIVYSITSRWPTKVMLRIPNGFFEEEYQKTGESIDAGRVNRFISVARHGCEPKRSEELLKAFSNAKTPSDWTLSLVGECTKEFKQLVEETINSKPYLKHRIVLHGPIYDRGNLIDMLSSSKVFVAVSSYEGFSLALLEAAACGCYCVSTNTGGASDVIGENGILLDEDAVPSVISVALERAITNSANFNHRRFARDIAGRFGWKTVLRPLADAMLLHSAEINLFDSSAL